MRRYFLAGVPSGIAAIGVWACPPGRAELICGWMVHQSLVNIAHLCGQTARDLLRTGRNLPLTEDITGVPLLAPGRELLGLMLVEGQVPRRGAARATFEELRQAAALVVRPPLPLCGPEVLMVSVKDLFSPRGRKALSHRLAEVLLRGDRHLVPLTQAVGAVRVVLPRRAGRPRPAPRNTLAARELQPLLEVPEARELEQQACRELLGQYDGDLHLSAGMLRLTPAVWRVYLEGVGVLVPFSERRPAAVN